MRCESQMMSCTQHQYSGSSLVLAENLMRPRMHRGHLMGSPHITIILKLITHVLLTQLHNQLVLSQMPKSSICMC